MMKIYKYIGMAMMTAGALAVTSCTEFSDYNEVVTDSNVSATQTLWENIRQNSQLSDFAALVEKSGFSTRLDQTQYYTVWAPLNGTYDASQFQSLENAALMRQFVQNHIATYSHRASGSINERVLMLNEKSYLFDGTSPYTFDDVAVNQVNLPSNNGLLHTLNGVATFYPNLYEYVTDPLLAQGKEIDSLRHFFQNYETTYLDAEKSVLGPIVNGMQTYVDSVMVTENTLWQTLNAKIQNEDSTYTFIMPTNKAWKSAHDRIAGYFNYLPSTVAQAFEGSNIAQVNAKADIDNAYLQDSLANLYLTGFLVYSNNDAYNQWVERTATQYGSDTIRSTTRAKLSNPTDILAQTREKLKMSNGVARIVDSLAFYPWETYSPELTYRPYNNSISARVLNGNTHTVRVDDIDPAKVDMSLSTSNESSLRYMWIEPNGGYAKPELDVYLPDVRSTTYEFYCVFVPRSVSQALTNSVTLPNRVIFTLNYCDADGKLQDHVFLDESEQNIADFQAAFKLTDNATNRTTIRAFSNDTSRVDTLYIGEFTFPVSYYGLEGNNPICPNLKITSPFSVFNKNLLAAYSRDLRIAAIILKPKELVEFEESKK